jgi:hypothetical protein
MVYICFKKSLTCPPICDAKRKRSLYNCFYWTIEFTSIKTHERKEKPCTFVTGKSSTEKSSSSLEVGVVVFVKYLNLVTPLIVLRTSDVDNIVILFFTKIQYVDMDHCRADVVIQLLE